MKKLSSSPIRLPDAKRIRAGTECPCPYYYPYLGVCVLPETDDVDEADAVEPDGDAADNTFAVTPVGDGLEGGVVDNLEVFGLEAESFLPGVDLVEGAEGVHDPELYSFHVLIV